MFYFITSEKLAHYGQEIIEKYSQVLEEYSIFLDGFYLFFYYFYFC